VISTAILTAPYAVPQPDSLDAPGSLTPVPEGSRDGEPIDKAMELDEAASALGFLALEWVRTASFFMSSISGIGVDGELFVGVPDDEGFRKRRIVGCRTKRCRRHLI